MTDLVYYGSLLLQVLLWGGWDVATRATLQSHTLLDSHLPRPSKPSYHLRFHCCRLVYVINHSSANQHPMSLFSVHCHVNWTGSQALHIQCILFLLLDGSVSLLLSPSHGYLFIYSICSWYYSPGYLFGWAPDHWGSLGFKVEYSGIQ